MRRIWWKLALAAWWIEEITGGVGDWAEDKAFIVKSEQESVLAHIKRKRTPSI